MGSSGDDGSKEKEKAERKSVRAPIELKVAYEKLNTFFADYTKNISKGGTFIRTDKPLPMGTEFLFRLQVPGLAEPLSLRGEVRWRVCEGEPVPQGVAADHEAGMGIRFVFANEAERRAVADAVEKLMIESLGQLIYSKLMASEKGGS